jgi:hypothetical protein
MTSISNEVEPVYIHLAITDPEALAALGDYQN